MKRMTVEVDPFLRELELYCYTSAIATLSGEDEAPFVIDLKRRPDGVDYGYTPYHKELFKNQLARMAKQGAALILRSFLRDERDPETGHPIKELRGYSLRLNGRRLEWNQISAEEMFLCQNTDAGTGEMLLPERGVRYCGSDSSH